MYILKGCPDCGGDLEWSDDEESWVCIQGAHRHSQRKMENLKRREENRQKSKAIDFPFYEPSPDELRAIYTPETVSLLPVPSKPSNKKAVYSFNEAHRIRIIAEAFAYGEVKAMRRWGIRKGHWPRIKRRWGLPLGRRGGNYQGAMSALPAKRALISSGMK